MHGIQCYILYIAFGESEDIEGIIESNNYETTIVGRVKRQATNSKTQLKKKRKRQSIKEYHKSFHKKENNNASTFNSL